MAKRVFALLIFIIGLFVIQPEAFAQDSIKVDTSSIVDVRQPSESVIEDYANNSDFEYSSAPDNPNSLRDRIFNFLIGLLLEIIGNPIGGFIFRAMLILAVASLVIVLINQLMGGELIYVFKKNNSKDGFSLGIEQEELESTDYDQLLKQAILDQDFHAATRFGYLIALKMLTQNEIISWGLQKTNLDYLKELKGHILRPDFEVLTTYYEFVEYGDFEIDKSQFETFQSTFDRFRSSINE
jgi:hypothetical protein